MTQKRSTITGCFEIGVIFDESGKMLFAVRDEDENVLDAKAEVEILRQVYMALNPYGYTVIPSDIEDGRQSLIGKWKILDSDLQDMDFKEAKALVRELAQQYHGGKGGRDCIYASPAMERSIRSVTQVT